MTIERHPHVLADDDAYVNGRLVIVMARSGGLRGIFIVLADDKSKLTADSAHGLFSTFDPGAGTHYIDEREPTDSSWNRCTNCSRFGHRDCYHAGVRLDRLERLKRDKRDKWAKRARRTYGKRASRLEINTAGAPS